MYGQQVNAQQAGDARGNARTCPHRACHSSGPTAVAARWHCPVLYSNSVARAVLKRCTVTAATITTFLAATDPGVLGLRSNPSPS